MPTERTSFKLAVAAACLAAGAGSVATAAGPAGPAPAWSWPAPEPTMRPWTRWWWLGNAVDPKDLDRMLTQFRDAGIGGVEICPIYGAKGYESRFVRYLSPEWLALLRHTTASAARLGLGVDLTTGTGWPMGGPWITPAEASELARIVREPNGEYTVQIRHGVQQVKRAAPGGQGRVIDPFSIGSLDAFLGHLDQAFAGYGGLLPRAEFHDSYEYRGNWSPDLFEQFARRRGYDLRAHLGALRGDADPGESARVLEDYRRTIAELHEEWIAHWAAWSHRYGELAREQAHGAPANIEDVYAAVDIPETEGAFNGGDDEQIPMMEFASSAAHVKGRRLASSETFTWLGEHFQVALSQLKPAVDRFYLAGINHIFFHGIPYSPADAPWPGWLFYAAVNFGPNGGLWHDLPAFNAYATRCESILQRGRPDNDLLLYFPVTDYWQKPLGPADARDSLRDPLLIQFATPGKWMWGTPFHAAAMALWRRGYGLDEITDELLTGAGADDGRIRVGGNSYAAIVVPRCRFMPPATMERLIALARAGATVVFDGPPPSDVPGYLDAVGRRERLRALTSALHLASDAPTPVGRGRISLGGIGALDALGIHREALADLGLRYVRRARGDGTDYFLVNDGAAPIDGWAPLARPAQFAALFDPLTGGRIGSAALQPGDEPKVYLQLPAGGSIILRLYRERPANASDLGPWEYIRPAGAARVLNGTWSVHFTEGGPVLPQDYTADRPEPWTDRDDAEARRFAGTATYTLDFDVDPARASDWLLSLGRVGDSAVVALNGREVGTLWSDPMEARVGRYLRPGRNHLEITVTNVAANRVRDLDRRHVNWKSFYEINFVNQEYKPFDASNWPVRLSGLAGPVSLQPMDAFEPSSS